MVQPRVGSVMVVGGCPLGHGKKSLALIVVACPLCHVNLDARQKQIEEEFTEKFDLPIIYFTQLMGLAFGIKSEELGLDKHFVDPIPFLKRTAGSLL